MTRPTLLRRLSTVLFLASFLLALLAAPSASQQAAGQESDKTDVKEKEAAKAETKEGDEPKPRLAVFRVHGSLNETPVDETFPFAGGAGGTSLQELVARFKKAQNDKGVKGVVLLLEGAAIGTAQTDELRQAMAAFRGAGKEIHTHTDGMTTREYAVLSGVSKLSMVPTGDLWLTGLRGESPYLRGMLNKLGVTPDFLTCGDYKSAAEMFTREAPSAQAEEMQNWLLDGIYADLVNLIAQGRSADPTAVKKWIDEGPYTAEGAKKAGLIDTVEHRQDFVQGLKKQYGDKVILDTKYGVKKGPQIDFSSPFGVLQFYSDLLSGPRKKTHGTSVAIVYVEGPIVLGKVEASPFAAGGGVAASTPIRQALDKAAEDDTIKAVVLRVNSPGGSATASEIILDATRRVKGKKPLIVSMGDVAGSGGYYVTCASNMIFADEATITGSIGVVGGKMATTSMWDKVGISWKGYSRGKNAGMLSSSQAFSPAERQKMQAWMDEIYGVFKGHVVAARGDRLKKKIDELAGGRVYTGKQALDLGLVDKIGTLDDALKFAAREAKVEDYEVRVVPEPKNFLEQIMEGAGQGDKEKSISLGGSLLEAALPLIKTLDPERVQAVARAIGQLQLLEREGVTLMMPELVFGAK